MQHTPKLHIFVGQDRHFFTLRQSYLHTIYVGRVNPKPFHEIRYSHLKNLSQNYQEAVEKAEEASKMLGVPLVVRGSETEQLAEIKRISAEEAEMRRRLAEEEYARAEEEAQARRREWWNNWKQSALCDLTGIKSEEIVVDLEFQPEGFLDKVKAAGWVANPNDPEKFTVFNQKQPTMPIGCHFGKPLNSIPRSYMQWLVYKADLCEIDAEESMHKVAFVAQWIRDNIEVPEITESDWVGQVGEKIEIEVSVDSVRSVNGYYGMTYLYKLIDSSGNDLTWFASRNALEGLTNIKIKATVKKHDQYNGRKQTVLTRVKVI